MPIIIKELSHIYDNDTPFYKTAISDINLDIEDQMVTAVIGETGSGKSTLVQHLNALLKPTSGSVTIDDFTMDAESKAKNLKSLRKKVGLVFQFPEYQLFEETIIKDVMFGPLNFNIEKEEALKSAKEALTLVGMDESYYEKSPLELSGGQKRRIAIAGILAMNPNVIVLDEPTAGLDPQGAKEMMDLFKSLNKTLVIVTHDMDHVLNYANQVVLLNHGKVIFKNDIKTFFNDHKLWETLQIEKPMIIKAKEMLIEKGVDITEDCFDFDTLMCQIVKWVNNNG